MAIDLNEQQTQLVSQIAQNFVIPNRARNDAATEAARQAAREQVEPRQREIEAGHIIVRQGDVVSELQIEALDALDCARRRSVGAASSAMGSTCWRRC